MVLSNKPVGILHIKGMTTLMRKPKMQKSLASQHSVGPDLEVLEGRNMESHQTPKPFPLSAELEWEAPVSFSPQQSYEAVLRVVLRAPGGINI